MKQMLDEINESVCGCKKCVLHNQPINKQCVATGHGKLKGWATFKHKPEYFLIGLNPSYNRFPNLQYAFGGENFNLGTGSEFVTLLKQMNLIDKIYLTNYVKCSTNDNKILKQHALACETLLLEELKLIVPKVVILLGEDVSKYFEESCLLNEFLGYNSIIKKKIWHPNYVFSYKREKIEEYKKQLVEALL